MIYHFGDCTFDTVRGELRRSGKEIHTTPQVLVVLRYLFEHRDRMVSRDELLEQCWHGSYVSDVTLTSCMRRVRQAIGQNQVDPALIATRHRRGYRFVAEVTEIPAPTLIPVDFETALLPTLETRMPLAAEREDAVASAAEPLVYEVIGERVMPRVEVEMPRGLTPFVGREAELALLRERWAYGQEGMGQVILLRGEAGIGKSRLVKALKAQIVAEQFQVLECRCSWYHKHTALYPVIDLLQRALHAQPAAPDSDPLALLEALLKPYPLPLDKSVPLLANLLSLPLPEMRYPPLSASPQIQREQTFEVLSDLLDARASQAPLLFIVEDLQWADPSMLDFLDLLIGQMPTTSILMVLTCRPLFNAPWTELTWMTSLTLNRLTRSQMYQMIVQAAGGKGFSAGVMEQLAEKADGVPLFIEELTRMILETGQFEEKDERYELLGELSQLSIPLTLQDSLMSRLDHLGPAREIAQWGSLLGREFTYEMIRQVIPHDDAALQAGLDQLVASELVFQRGRGGQTRFRFKHALVQDAAYQSLRQSERQDRHQRIAQVLAAHYPETAEMQPELLAYHYAEARLQVQAIPYWQHAGERAVARSANLEAITHLTMGLEALEALSDTTERLSQELHLLLPLGMALYRVKGFAALEVEHAYNRARELCQQLEDTSALYSVLERLRSWYMNRAQLRITQDLAEQCLHEAQRQQDSTLIMVAHKGLGITLYHAGKFISALTTLEQFLAFFNSKVDRMHSALDWWQDHTVTGLSHAAWVLWFLGYPDQSRARSQAALALSAELDQPFRQANAFYWAAQLHQYHRASSHVRELAEAAIALSTEQNFVQQIGQGLFLRGWALAMQGQPAAGLSHMREGLATWESTGAELLRPYYLVLLAEISADAGQACEGLELLDKALVAVDKSGERSWEAEVHRLRGTLLLAKAEGTALSPAVTEEVAVCFQQAMTIARAQGAKSLELRAAMSLARLWQRQGKRQDAYELLQPVYGWFTEGFDTADLQDARALLDRLEAGDT